MEKLIKLINKWQEEKHPDGIYLPVVAYRDGIFWSDSDCLSSVMDEIHLISKPCGFIEWLVENDKIDFEKCGFNIKNYLSYNKWYDKGIVLAENYDNDTFVVREFYSPYEQLLMLLSISDKPISDLISYLK